MMTRNALVAGPSRGPAESSTSIYYCRVGRHGQIGKFRDILGQLRKRDDAVLVRTTRGVEPAIVLSAVQDDSLVQQEVCEDNASAIRSDGIPLSARIDGKILRLQSPEDRLLIKQLTASAQSASFACQKYLAENHRSDCLLDVEPMMDGKTLYFHFAGEPDESLTVHLQSLAEIFQQDVQSSEFASLLENGCGPGCGTSEKGGCGSDGGCAVCVVAKLRSGDKQPTCSSTVDQ